MRSRAAAGYAIRGLAASVAAALACFSFRRVLLLIASLLPARPVPDAAEVLPSVTLVIAARNEARSMRALTASLEAIDYPADSLWTVVVDDCSTDSTGELLAGWAEGHPRTTVLRLNEHVGKHQAQREGMAAAPSEVVVFCDADVRPRPDCLRRLTEVFADGSVAGAAALVVPENASVSPIARYAAVESWVTQLVTSAGKDRLDLNAPTPGGCCAYRRVALDEVAWTSPEPGADMRLTVALTRAGWRTRFASAAVAETAVVHRWSDYWHQHIRWARNLLSSASAWSPGEIADRGPRRGPLHRRAEAWMMAAGYSDRLLLVAALPLAAAGRLAARHPAIYLTVAASEVVTALHKARVGREGHTFLLWTVALFAFDVVASVAAAGAHLVKRPRTWRQTR